MPPPQPFSPPLLHHHHHFYNSTTSTTPPPLHHHHNYHSNLSPHRRHHSLPPPPVHHHHCTILVHHTATITTTPLPPQPQRHHCTTTTLPPPLIATITPSSLHHHPTITLPLPPPLSLHPHPHYSTTTTPSPPSLFHHHQPTTTTITHPILLKQYPCHPIPSRPQYRPVPPILENTGQDDLLGLQMAEAAERKPVIGLSWEPKLPLLPSVTKNGSAKSQPLPPETVAAYRPSTELVDGMFLPPNDPKKLNKLMRKQIKDTAGKNWFDMPAPTITPELKKDMQLLKINLTWLSGVIFGIFTINKVGTVIESPSDFFSGRLIKKERKATLADELLSDQTLGQYRKRKVREINEKNRPAGVDKWKIRGKQSWKRAKQRRH
ncbi:hypothetical protein RHMOL_Rhmol04G0382300 [Rhododendron molle]|uniref:Uncharacterized protein n=2 Tax=Rhododendron molle TaxID=49168 RepID=A0ACC0PB63_RHOML|nr:hypothetical protein RHMOL_Rhmol04G0382300 [Rhododendron molle]